MRNKKCILTWLIKECSKVGQLVSFWVSSACTACCAAAMSVVGVRGLPPQQFLTKVILDVFSSTKGHWFLQWDVLLWLCQVRGHEVTRCCRDTWRRWGWWQNVRQEDCEMKDGIRKLSNKEQVMTMCHHSFISFADYYMRWKTGFQFILIHMVFQQLIYSYNNISHFLPSRYFHCIWP